MSNFKTITASGKAVSFVGELKLLSEEKDWKRKVEVWLLNSQVNSNDWQYLNLEEHKKLFVGTPILVAYVDGKIGDGHNFEQVRDKDGKISASFLDSTAERIVGWFNDEKDIRIVNKDGIDWIVGTGYIWKWYAQELVSKLEGQGLQGMSVSIETLIDEYHKNGSTEVFTKYQILGTTILGDNVAPAVANANIRALSVIGNEEVRKMTLRVASLETEKQKNNYNSQKTKKIGEKKTMKLGEVEAKFNGYTVLAIDDNNNVALLSANGVPHISSVAKDGDEIIVGAKEEVKANAVFGEGENSMTLTVESITERLCNEKNELLRKLEEETELRESAQATVANMQKAEKARREEVVRNAIKNRLQENKNNSDVEIDDTVCDELLTDEKVNEYSEMENKAGEFCGDKQACNDVDAICMAKIREANKVKANKSHIWNEPDMIKTNGAGSSFIDEVISSTINSK